MATEKSAKPAAAESVHEAPKPQDEAPRPQDETPKPVVGPDNPEGIDLAAGDENADTAFQE